MKLWLTLLVLFAACGQAHPSADAAGITEYPKLISADYWQSLTPNGEETVLSPNEIESFNRRVVQTSPSVYDLADYPAAHSASTLRAYIDHAELLDDALYVNGAQMSWQYKQNIRREMNLDGVLAENPVGYGIVVRRSNLRGLPTGDGWFSSAHDKEFDNLQETAVDPSEAVAVLHASASGEFSYVQLRNYRGWLRAEDIAMTDRETWLSYVKPKDFLVVAANRFALTINGEEIRYQMGSKLPLRGAGGEDVVCVPARAADGALIERTVTVPKSPALHRGFLPYTRDRIIAQSFQFLHDPYGWGGLKDSVDCSSFIADIYRTVGIELPRNADEQEMTAGTRYAMQTLRRDARSRLLRDALKPGDVLFFDGHTMLYLGESNGTPFIIHSLGSHTKHRGDGAREKVPVMRVVVSDLSLRRYSGVTFLDALTSAVSYH